MLFHPTTQTVWAQGQAALTGTVSSEAEGNMEGVVVTAKKPGSIVQVSVTTDAQGRYTFPENRLEPGRIYDQHPRGRLRHRRPDQGDGGAREDRHGRHQAQEDQESRQPAHQRRVDDEHPRHRRRRRRRCSIAQGCHTLERIMRSTHDSDEWTQVITRMMGYGAVSQPIKPQRMLDRTRAGTPEQYRKMADYLATINLSSSDHWSYELKTLPRPKGRDTRAIVTEYDMVRPTTEPHDVLVDKDGSVWYTDFGEMFIGKFDPKTLKLTEYPIKKFKDKAPTGLLSIEFDHTGKIWFDTMYQGSLGYARPEDRRDRLLSAAAGIQRRPRAAELHRAALRRRRQGVDQERRHPAHLPARSRDQHLGALPPDRRAADRQACRHLSGHGGLQEQPVDGRIHRRPSRQDRREDHGR